MASTEEQTQNGSVQEQETLITTTLETNQEPQNPQIIQEETLKDEPATTTTTEVVSVEKPKWPGWPGSCVFRLVVPVLKVGSIIGRKGELVKKMCEETGAKIRVLDGPVSSPDRIVLISGKEEPEAALSPAMDAVIRIFRRVSGLSEGEGDGDLPGAAGAAFCSIRLLVASTQAVNLIGKQGSLIKPIQQNTGASIRVLSNDEMSIYATPDEKIVEIQGEALKVLKALESVIGHLRKFLVDHSVLPLFEKSYNAPAVQEREAEPWSERTMLSTSRAGLGDYPPRQGLGDYPPRQGLGDYPPRQGLGDYPPRQGLGDYPPPTKRDSQFSERESQLDSHYHPAGLSLYGKDPALSLYGQDPALSGTRTSGVGRAGNSVITQISQTVQMQIPLAFAEDIIGIGGANIAYIRRTSGAILTVQESRGLADEITVEIKGSSSQVQTAQQLMQEFMGSHKESLPSSYGQLDTGSRQSSYSNLGSGSYPSSSYGGQQYGGGYGSSFGAGGGYNSYRS
ncbi:RNA-binding KH domain-containing protein PEPPER-like [Lycium barbarum]|uniref:RNA-binding KH domain-containing protein PEPPER-like n=1 Tax=Lycium barbarum TaxID=112863 RepID=UPI00293ED968|nr:RNA-binding KH domain-containing protein PEPPER-like [Lycium barbarum]